MRHRGQHAAPVDARPYAAIGALLATAAVACVVALFGCAPNASSGQAPESASMTATQNEASGSSGNAPEGQAPQGEPPAKPDGESGDGQPPQGEPPAKPDGNAQGGPGQGGTPPDKPDGAPGGQGGPGQGSGTVSNGTGATTFTSDDSTSGQAYTSTASDENAARVEGGASVTLENATITKSGDSTSSESSDFYGLNAAILAYDGSKFNVAGGTVNTDSSGSNGIFSYGEGTEVTVSDTVIRCTKGNSGGIEVAGGATLTATNLDIDTQGESSAAIRSDRGGGTETVTGGTYVTHGGHSPAVYSTADVTVNGATLTAENCEGVVIEGKNSVTLNDCNVTGNVNGVATRTGVVNNVMIYQSMSGDASVGTGNFTMSGGSFNAAHGTLFYVTNTDAAISLEGVDIQNADGQLLVAAGNDGRWGTEGSNGGKVTLTATDQKLEGSITVDQVSSLALTLKESSYTGSINASGQAGTVSVNLESGSSWTLDGDSYLTELTGDTSRIDLNGHTLYVNGEAWSA